MFNRTDNNYLYDSCNIYLIIFRTRCLFTLIRFNIKLKILFYCKINSTNYNYKNIPYIRKLLNVINVWKKRYRVTCNLLLIYYVDLVYSRLILFSEFGKNKSVHFGLSLLSICNWIVSCFCLAWLLGFT